MIVELPLKVFKMLKMQNAKKITPIHLTIREKFNCLIPSICNHFISEHKNIQKFTQETILIKHSFMNKNCNLFTDLYNIQYIYENILYLFYLHKIVYY